MGENEDTVAIDVKIDEGIMLVVAEILRIERGQQNRNYAEAKDAILSAIQGMTIASVEDL